MRAAFLSLSLSLLPGFFKCCVHALILSLAGLKQLASKPTCNKTPFTLKDDLPSARMLAVSFWIAIRAQIASMTAVPVASLSSDMRSAFWLLGLTCEDIGVACCAAICLASLSPTCVLLSRRPMALATRACHGISTRTLCRSVWALSHLGT